MQLKIETNGQRFDAAVAERLARLPIRSIQVSLDGDTEDVYGRQRPGGSLAKAHAACRAVRAAGLPLEVTFAPTRINIHEADARHRARAGARRVPLQHRQADARRHRRAPLEHARADGGAIPGVSSSARARRRRLKPAMELCYSPFDLEEALRASLDEPPATLLVLPNGWVKVAAALPHICADLRKATLARSVAGVSRRVARSRTVIAAARSAVEDESRHAQANRWQLLSVVRV